MSMAGWASPFAALRRCALFAGLDDSDVSGAALLMAPRTLAAGEELCRAGEPGDRLFVIVNGLAHALANGEEDAPSRRLTSYASGDAVGAVSLVTEDPQPETVVAGMPTDVLELRKDSFDDLARRFPVILANVTRILSSRLARTGPGAQRAGERGAAIALIVSETLAAYVPEVVAAAAAASPAPLTSLDTRRGFDSAIAALDDALVDHATVVVVARAHGKSAPLLLDHVDHAVILAEDERDVDRVAPHAGGRVEVVLVRPDADPRPAARPAAVGGLPVTRLLRRDGQGPLHPPDLAWLGRRLSRTRLGLALGAGGAKGYAHVGVLQVLEEAGYCVDCVAGSSIGAIVGACLALGQTAAEIDLTLRGAFTERAVAETSRLGLSGQSTGLAAMGRILRRATAGRSFADVRIPLVVMAVDLTDRVPAPITDGLLSDGLLAATALAGVFPPHERDGHRLVDGLALVPVPTGAVLDAGADVALSVNLMGRETLPAWPGRAPPPPPEGRARGVRMLEDLLEVMDLMQLDTGARQADLADVAVTPRFGPGTWRDYHLADLFLAAGRSAMRERLPALRALARPTAPES